MSGPRWTRELQFNMKQNQLKVELEMWLMDAIPEAYGFDDSEELDEELQEEAQADIIEQICREPDTSKVQDTLAEWLKGDIAPDKKDDLIGKMTAMALKVRLAAKKKK